MERTKEQWMRIGEVLSLGIVPGCFVEDWQHDRATVPDVSKWIFDIDDYLKFEYPGGYVWLSRPAKGALIAKYATVIDPPQPLSGKEVSVTIEGQTYTAIIK